MGDILHILVNDEGISHDLFPVFNFFDDLNIPFIQVKNNNQLDYLLNYLQSNQDIAIWVHPNASVRKDNNVTTPGEASAIALSLHSIEFSLISRYPDDVSEKLLKQLNKKAIDLNELSESIRNIKPIKVGSIKTKLREMKTEKIQRSEVKADIAIITALYDGELNHLLSFLEDLHSIDGYETLKMGTLKGSNKQVLIDFQNQMGMVDSAILTNQILNDFDLKYFILCGVCGGRESKGVNLLDLIIPDKIFEYMTGKYEKGIIKPYLRVANLNNKIAIDAKDKIIAQIKASVHAPFSKIFNELNVHTRTLACGNIVVKTDKYIDEIAERDEEVVGLEMESYGFARAIENMKDRRVKSLVIKSVMDYTDSTKTDEKKQYAGYVSAMFTYLLAKDYL